MDTKSMDTPIRLPENFSEYDGDTLMSNYDNRIEKEIANSIKGKELYGHYSAWDFSGRVWWQNDQWRCEVWCYQSWRQTVSCDTLEQIMEEVMQEYGSD